MDRRGGQDGEHERICTPARPRDLRQIPIRASKGKGVAASPGRCTVATCESRSVLFFFRSEAVPEQWVCMDLQCKTVRSTTGSAYAVISTLTLSTKPRGPRRVESSREKVNESTFSRPSAGVLRGPHSAFVGLGHASGHYAPRRMLAPPDDLDKSSKKLERGKSHRRGRDTHTDRLDAWRSSPAPLWGEPGLEPRTRRESNDKRSESNDWVIRPCPVIWHWGFPLHKGCRRRARAALWVRILVHNPHLDLFEACEVHS